MIIPLSGEIYELFVCGPASQIHKLSHIRIGCMPNNFGEGGLSGEEVFISYEASDNSPDELEEKRQNINREIYITKSTGIIVYLVRWEKRGHIINADHVI